MDTSKRLHILLVEDVPTDAFFFEHALRDSRLNASLTHVHNGQEAIDYLLGKGRFADRAEYPFPEMIVTDLKMPIVDGFGLLEWLKKQSECAVIPALVLSASFLEKDVVRAYQLGANAFLAKPTSVNELGRILLTTYSFWSLCQRPPPPANGKCE